MKVFWTLRAFSDAGEIQDYIAKDNPAAAMRTARAIRDAVSILLAHPQAGRSGRITGTRELIVRPLPYIIAYRIAGAGNEPGSRIDILAVLHAARDWPESLD